jgi:hypothetical protein
LNAESVKKMPDAVVRLFLAWVLVFLGVCQRQGSAARAILRLGT